MSLFRPRFFEVPQDIEDGISWLACASQMSPEKIFELMQLGAIYHERKRLLKNQSFKQGAIIKIYPDPKRYPGPWELSILFENQDLVVIDKPSGLPSIPTPGNAFENAFSLVAKIKDQFLYPIHRLDEGTCGVLMLGKTKQSVAEYQTDRAHNRLTKIYRCLSETQPPIGHHVHFMQKGLGRMHLATDESQGQRAEMLIKEVQRAGPFFLSTIQLITGRTHQIRFQMEQLGCAVLGDSVYGGNMSFGNRLKLQAFQVVWNENVFTSKLQIAEGLE